MMDLDSKNAYTFCSRDKPEEELELSVAYHYMLESFRAIYTKIVTVQWHFGNMDRTDLPQASTCLANASCKGTRRPQYTSTCLLQEYT